MSSPFDSNWSRILLVSAIVILPFPLVRSLVVQPFIIPASSMMPTVELGDYLVTTKYNYGYRNFSFPFGSHLPAFSVGETTPSRGDVVIFRFPPNPEIDYIKRVIGLPGDRVQVRNGLTYINGTALDREYTGKYEELYGANPDYAGGSMYREVTPEGRSYLVLELVDQGEGDNTQEFWVPPGSYFVMGDNRDNSSDSRYTVGYVPAANIYAKAWFVFSSNSGFRLIE